MQEIVTEKRQEDRNELTRCQNRMFLDASDVALEIVMNKIGCSECISKSIFYIKETGRNEITLTVDP